VGKHRHERFREGFAVVRIDDYDLPERAKEELVTIKEIWLTAKQAEAEAARLNALNGRQALPILRSVHARRTRGLSTALASKRQLSGFVCDHERF
jgi:hypothetical protein